MHYQKDENIDRMLHPIVNSIYTGKHISPLKQNWELHILGILVTHNVLGLKVKLKCIHP